MRPLIVLGCTSSAGKSLLVTALCRWFARQGVDVAPFKAQNMSNNARVVDGGEIGVAQWLQARAAGVQPTVAMNPVLVKPESETRSHVVVLGRPRPDIAALPWVERGGHVWPAMRSSLDALRQAHELVIIEGAGSPAEINLPDLVNNRVTDHADAAAILVADIDRGGAFAHLYGTWSLVPDTTRDRLRAFVLNKFRGDAGLLDPAPSFVTERTGMAHLGTLPTLLHDLPDEEGATVRGTPVGTDALDVVVARFPYGSNLDEFHLLAHACRLRFSGDPREVDEADMVILPGSKHVAADLAWMRATSMDKAVGRAVERGARVLGICGGAMMLGRSVSDPHGVEGAAEGLGILGFETTMDPDKIAARATVAFSGLPATWRPFEGLSSAGYEIRNGRISASGTGDEKVWASGNVLATTVHGIFEDPDLVQALVGIRPKPVLEPTFDLLADAIDANLASDLLWSFVRS